MKEFLIFNPVFYERRFKICKKTNTLLKQISVNFKSISFELKKLLEKFKNDNC
jgi:hypothetical protein